MTGVQTCALPICDGRIVTDNGHPLQPEFVVPPETQNIENTGSAGLTYYHYKITPDKGYSVYAVYVNGKKKGRSTKVILKNPAEGTELKAEMGFRVRLKDPQKLCRLKKKDFIVKIGGSKTIKLQPKIGRKITYVNINGKKKYFSSDYEQKVKHRRSEERRVGKECRSRWSPYH